MRPFDAVHVSEPGLVVVELAAGDEETALAAVAGLGERWATSGPSEVWRVPGEPGVRVRTYAKTRRGAGYLGCEPSIKEVWQVAQGGLALQVSGCCQACSGPHVVAL